MGPVHNIAYIVLMLEERPAKPTLTTRCRDKCHYGLGACYKFCTGAPDIRSAAIECTRHNASILELGTPGEMSLLPDMLKEEGRENKKWYIGGKKINGRWFWFHLTERKHPRGGGTTRYRVRKKPMFPANSWISFFSQSKKKCLSLSLSKRAKPDWCRRRRGLNFICQKRVSSLPAVGDGVCGKKMIDAKPVVSIALPSVFVPKIMGSRGGVGRGEHPWQARLVSYDPVTAWSDHKGGATVLSEFWVLTAAHCIGSQEDVFYLRVVVGDNDRWTWEEGEQVFDVAQVIKHKRYKHKWDYDIALVRVTPQNGRGIVFNQYVQPACLPQANSAYSPGLNCSISGWGATTTSSSASTELRAATVPLVATRICQNLVNRYDNVRIFSKRRMICAGYPIVQGVDSSEGDSGGPLICPTDGQHTVVGVTAFGLKPFGQNPGVYSSVQAYLPWINKTIKRNTRKTQKLRPKRKKSKTMLNKIIKRNSRKTQKVRPKRKKAKTMRRIRNA
ncbi:hypothetical protein EGW08_020437 [Elysia chlorotica]|uniref:Peptidase S1 domain-containing protein n=1 Tax=Elysia chlorotica TaxID=188477 RepID=A0A433SRR0_ELYCH|nr:hypothetical protein EGW08_020437 [Elysia chlorotica]